MSLAFYLLLVIQPQTVYSKSIDYRSESTISNDRAQDVVIKHRKNKGRWQHRRWDNNKKQWLDSKWIDD